MKANNKADQIERQTDRQKKISLFTGEKKKGELCSFAQLREALKTCKNSSILRSTLEVLTSNGA